MKIIFFSYLHPDQNPGGQQRIAYDQYLDAANRFGKANVLFIASTFGPSVKSADSSSLLQVGEFEFIYQNSTFDFRFFTNNDFDGARDLFDMIMSFEPDLLHVHHFMGFGIDFFVTLRARLEKAVMIFTAHEYLAVCHNNGHLLQRKTNRICKKITPVSCAKCLPDNRFDYFFQRNSLFSTFLNKFDGVIAVSEFANQTINSILPVSHITTIPNGPFINRVKPYKARCRIEGVAAPVRIAYIGQIHESKGLHLLLAAIGKIRSAKLFESPLGVAAWGTFVDDDHYKGRILALAKEVSAEDCTIELKGEYDSSRLCGMLSTVQIVVISSTWPESYCLTIDEAIYAGKIVVAPNFPAVTERFRFGGQLIGFEMGNEDSLFDSLVTAIKSIDSDHSVDVVRSYRDEAEYLNIVNDYCLSTTRLSDAYE